MTTSQLIAIYYKDILKFNKTQLDLDIQKKIMDLNYLLSLRIKQRKDVKR